MKALPTLFLILLTSFIHAQSSDRLVPYFKNGFWGLSKGGELIVEPIYDDYKPLGNGHYSMIIGENNRLFGPDGQMFGEPHKFIRSGSSEYFTFSDEGRINVIQGEIVGGKWGLLDKKGNVIMEPAFHQLIPTDWGIAKVQVEDNWGNWGIIDYDGKWLVEATYETKSFDMRPHPTITMIDKDHCLIEPEEEKYAILNIRTGQKTKINHTGIWGPWFQGEVAITNGAGGQAINTKGEVIVRNVGSTSSTTRYIERIIVDKEPDAVVYSKKGEALATLTGVGRFRRDRHGYLLFENNGVSTICDSIGNVLFKHNGPLGISSTPGYFTAGKSVLDVSGTQVGPKFEGNVEDYCYGVYSVENPQNPGKERLYNKGQELLFDFDVQWVQVVEPNLLQARLPSRKVVYFTPSGKAHFESSPVYKVVGTRKVGLEDSFTGKVLLKRDYEKIAEMGDNYLVKEKDKGWRFYHPDKGFFSDYYEWMSEKVYTLKKDWVTIDGLITAKHKGKTGILDSEGNVIVPLGDYDVRVIQDLDNPEKYMYYCRTKYVADLLTPQGEFFMKIDYKITQVNDLLVVKDTTEEQHLMQADGRILKSGKIYSKVQLDDNYSSFKLPKGEYYLWNRKTQELVKTDGFIKDIWFFEDDPYFVFEGKKGDGLFDGKLATLLVGKYDYAKNKAREHLYFNGDKQDVLVKFSEAGGVELVYADNIEYLGKVRSYEDASQEGESRYLWGDEGVYSILDKALKPINDKTYTWLKGNTYSYGRILAKDANGKYGWVSRTGSTIVPFKYDDYVEDGDDFDFFQMKRDGELVLVDGEGHEFMVGVDKIDYDLYSMSEHFVGCEKDGKKTIMDYDGTIVLADVDDYAFPEYLEDFWILIIQKNGKWGIFDLHKQDWLEQPIYDSQEDVYFETDDDAIFVLGKDGQYQVYSFRFKEFLLSDPVDKISKRKLRDGLNTAKDGKNGLLHWSFEANRYVHVKEVIAGAEIEIEEEMYSVQLYAVRIGKEVGIQHADGRMIVPTGYRKISVVYDGSDMYFITRNDKDKYGLYDEEGKLLVKVEFDEITDTRKPSPADQSFPEYMFLGIKEGQEFLIQKGGEIWPIN